MTKRFRIETLAYGVIAAIPVLVQSTDPVTWRTWLLAAGTAITAMKAKTSKGADRPQAPDELPTIDISRPTAD